jgi:hypothetical protein
VEDSPYCTTITFFAYGQTKLSKTEGSPVGTLEAGGRWHRLITPRHSAVGAPLEATQESFYCKSTVCHLKDVTNILLDTLIQQPLLLSETWADFRNRPGRFIHAMGCCDEQYLCRSHMWRAKCLARGVKLRCTNKTVLLTCCWAKTQQNKLRPGLDIFQILIFYTFSSLHRIFRHMHRALNIDKKLIAQFSCKITRQNF